MATKRKLTKVAAPVEQSTELGNFSRIDESRTAVSVPGCVPSVGLNEVELIEVSSDSESNYDDISDPDDGVEKLESVDEAPSIALVNGDIRRKEADRGAEDQGAEELDTEPSFGDLIRNHETVDVAAALGDRKSGNTNVGLAAAPSRQILPPSTSSLGIVLAQALRTDDTDLLESCLHTSNTTVIRNTIQRLDSSLAGSLITHLAARLHRRPGRAHNLMTFVQWTLIAHGGALATQPDVQKRLSELNKVLEERTRGLNSLLSLKGKLDMLEAQMTLRRGNKMHRTRVKDGNDSESDGEQDPDGKEGIVYVEGQEDDPSGVPRQRDEEEDDFPVVNGDASDSEEDDDDVDENDIGIEESPAESLDEDEVDHNDIEEDSAEEDETEAEAAPPAKVQKKSNGQFSKKEVDV